jgi:hypothetical protein
MTTWRGYVGGRLNGPGFGDPARGDGLEEDAFDFLADGGEFILLDKFTREYGEYPKKKIILLTVPLLLNFFVTWRRFRK